jgi:hypothetical protein
VFFMHNPEGVSLGRTRVATGHRSSPLRTGQAQDSGLGTHTLMPVRRSRRSVHWQWPGPNLNRAVRAQRQRHVRLRCF